MYAKLHFNGSNNTSVLEAIVRVATGVTDKNLLSGITGIDLNKCSISTSRNAAGWSLDYASSDKTVYVISAPCADSVKRKYVRLYTSGSAVAMFTVGSGNPVTVTATGNLTFESATQQILYQSGSNYHMPNSNNFEVRISASARHLLVTAGVQGYATGYGLTVQGGQGAVTQIFEHTCADSYFTDNTDYIPVVAHGSIYNSNAGIFSSNNSVSYSNPLYLSPKYRNLTGNGIVDVTASTANAGVYTKMNAGNLLSSAMPNNGKMWVSESAAVTALYPFGVSNPAMYFRGGSITDLCGVYMAAPGAFSDFVEIKAGSSETVYSMWNFGYSGYFLAVPRG